MPAGDEPVFDGVVFTEVKTYVKLFIILDKKLSFVNYLTKFGGGLPRCESIGFRIWGLFSRSRKPVNPLALL